MRLCASALLLCLTLSGTATAQTTPIPENIRTMCTQIQTDINRLAPFTQTSCRSGGGNTPQSNSFLVISLQVVWDDADTKQAWLEFVVEAAGNAMAADATAKIDEIIVADPSQLAERVAWGIPGPLVREIHAAVKAATLAKQDVYAKIAPALVRKPINAR